MLSLTAEFMPAGGPAGGRSNCQGSVAQTHVAQPAIVPTRRRTEAADKKRPPSRISGTGFRLMTRGSNLARFLAVAKVAVPTLAIGLSFVAPRTTKGLELSAAPTGRTIVRVVSAIKECFSDSIFTTGFVVPKQEAIVLVYDGFRITEILAREGDQVKAGQVLARLARREGLSADGGAASARPAPTELKAPAAGLVIHSSATAGGVASQRGEPTFLIMIDGEMEIEAEVSSIHVPKLRAGQRARIKIEYGADANGVVRRVPGEIDRTSQIGRARLSIAQDSSLRIGMFARATIDAGDSCSVAVPRESVFAQTSGTSVQIVHNGKVETRVVKLGLSSDTKFEIREGLGEGDIVVANAGASLHDGDQVETRFVEELDN
jgi:multidrug efflux pump subunit AcrA (membrane-fusion protein)